MSRIFQIHDFIQPKTEYKVVSPFKVSYLLLSKRPNSYNNNWKSASTHFYFKKGYTSNGLTRVGPVWCHYWQEIPIADLTSIEQSLGIKFNAGIIDIPGGIECSTTKKPYSQQGIRFRSLAKHKSPLGISSFVIPWSELYNIKFELL